MGFRPAQIDQLDNHMQTRRPNSGGRDQAPSASGRISACGQRSARDLANFYRRNRGHAEIAEKLGARGGLTIRVIGMEAGA